MAFVFTREFKCPVFYVLKRTEYRLILANLFATESKINITPKFKFGQKRDTPNDGLKTKSSGLPVITKPKTREKIEEKRTISGDLLEIDDNFHQKHRKFKVEPKKKLRQRQSDQDFNFKRHHDYKQQFPTSGDEILFGIHPVLLALRSKRRIIHKLLLKQTPDELKLNPRLEEIKNSAAIFKIPTEFVNKKILDHLSGQRPHQSVCLDVGRLENSFYVFSDKDLTTTAKNRQFPIWLLLNKIHDPMNFGAIIRTSYYFGVDKLLCVENDSCPPTPVVSKASSGALEVTPISIVGNVEHFLEEKSDQGWEIIGTMTTNSTTSPQNVTNIHDYNLTKPVIVIIGNEGDGLDENIIKYCTTHLTVLPGYQNLEQITSLNVSVATGVILHQLTHDCIINNQ